MHAYATVDCNYFVVARSWPPAARYLYLWAVIVDHMHRATGICRYNRTTASDETGLPPAKLVKAEEWLVQNEHWYIEDDWLWVCKRARRELITNAGTPNIRMTASARNYQNHAGLPKAMRAKFVEMYGPLFSDEDRVSIGYRYPISTPPPVPSVSGAASEPVAHSTPIESKGLEEGGGSNSGKDGIPTPPPQVVERYVAAYREAHAKFTGTEPAIEDVRDNIAINTLLVDYPALSLQHFLHVATTLWATTHCPTWALSIRGLCGHWKEMEGKAVVAQRNGGKDEELERVARARLARAIETADKELAAAIKLTDCVRATQVREQAQCRRDRLDDANAWERFRYV